MSVTLMTETNLYKDDAIADGLDDASKVATNYLSYNSTDGLTVGRTGQSERAVITSDGMEIYDGQNEKRAEFKAVTRLGEAGKANLRLDYHSMQLQDIEGNTYVHLSDIRKENGFATVYANFIGDGSTRQFSLYYKASPYNILESIVTVNNTQLTPNTDYSFNSSTARGPYIAFASAPANNSTIKVQYETSDRVVAYTFGDRIVDSEMGDLSFVNGSGLTAKAVGSHAEGEDCTTELKASFSHVEGLENITNSSYSHAEGKDCITHGECSHAEGENCTTGIINDNYTDSQKRGYYSHVEGSGCTTYGRYSHAEGKDCATGSSASALSGYYSHAEGKGCITNGECSHAEGENCTTGAVNLDHTLYGGYAHAEGYGCIARGKYAHAEGYECVAKGNYSHATGEGTVTSSNYAGQFVCGSYNVESYSYKFIMGGGSYDSNRKNIFTVDNSGNTTIAGTLTQSSDKRLKNHLVYMSDQEQDVNDFIESLKPAYFEKDQAKHLGFYAQDVQLSDKWDCLVDMDSNDYLTLNYIEIIAPLVAYVQNQQKKIDSLEERIARLEQLINQQ